MTYETQSGLMYPFTLNVFNNNFKGSFEGETLKILSFKDMSGYERCLHRSSLKDAKKGNTLIDIIENAPTKGFKIHTPLNLSVTGYEDSIVVEDPRGFFTRVSSLSLFSMFKTSSLNNVESISLSYLYVNKSVSEAFWMLINEDDPDYSDIIKRNALIQMKETKAKSEAIGLSKVQPGDILILSKNGGAFVYIGKHKVNNFFLIDSNNTDIDEALKDYDYKRVFIDYNTYYVNFSYNTINYKYDINHKDTKKNLIIARSKKEQHVFLKISKISDWSKWSKNRNDLIDCSYFDLRKSDIASRLSEINNLYTTYNSNYLFTVEPKKSINYSVYCDKLNDNTVKHLTEDFLKSIKGCEDILSKDSIDIFTYNVKDILDKKTYIKSNCSGEYYADIGSFYINCIENNVIQKKRKYEIRTIKKSYDDEITSLIVR